MLRKERHRAFNRKKLQFKPDLYSAPHNLAFEQGSRRMKDEF